MADVRRVTGRGPGSWWAPAATSPSARRLHDCATGGNISLPSAYHIPVLRPTGPLASPRCCAPHDDRSRHARARSPPTGAAHGCARWRSSSPASSSASSADGSCAATTDPVTVLAPQPSGDQGEVPVITTPGGSGTGTARRHRDRPRWHDHAPRPPRPRRRRTAPTSRSRCSTARQPRARRADRRRGRGARLHRRHRGQRADLHRPVDRLLPRRAARRRPARRQGPPGRGGAAAPGLGPLADAAPDGAEVILVLGPGLECPGCPATAPAIGVRVPQYGSTWPADPRRGAPHRGARLRLGLGQRPPAVAGAGQARPHLRRAHHAERPRPAHRAGAPGHRRACPPATGPPRSRPRWRRSST